MVVSAINHYLFIIWNIDIFNKWISFSPIHLYFILVEREKGLESIVALALVSLIAFLWLNINWLIYVAIGLLMIPLISKKLANIIGYIWFSFAEYLGTIMNYIIMFLVFYFVLFPVSLLQRLVGKNQILSEKGNNSYFHQRNYSFSEKDIDDPW